MIQIFTDSTSDFTHEDAEQLGIHCLPLTVLFGEVGYRDGIDINPTEFYRRLRTVTELPTTSQINPGEFEEAFRACLERNEEVIGIFVSSELSGTFQSARLAAEALGHPESLFLVDSRTVTLGLNALVREAVKMRDSGLPAAQIAAEATRLTERVRLIAIVETLKYLRMGGRLSAFGAVMGEMLNICPLIHVRDGQVMSHAKARGHKGALRLLRDYCREHPIDRTRTVVAGHTDNPGRLDELSSVLGDLIEGAPLFPHEIGCVVGVHAGPDAAGLAYFEAE